MNLFNQNYYIQIRMCKLEKKKQKKKTKTWGAKKFYGKFIGEYI